MYESVVICEGVTLPVRPAWAMETRARLSDVTGVIDPKSRDILSTSGRTTRVNALFCISSWSRRLEGSRCCCWLAFRPSRRWLMLVVSEDGCSGKPSRRTMPRNMAQMMRNIRSMAQTSISQIL